VRDGQDSWPETPEDFAALKTAHSQKIQLENCQQVSKQRAGDASESLA
jgi:hypothetical protein